MQPIHEEFLEKYEPDINLKVNVAFQNYHEREDVKQEMRMELIKSYKSKYKYADWHNIVRGIINRRIIDYRKDLYRTPLLDLQNYNNGKDNFLDHILDNKSSDVWKEDRPFTEAIEASDLLDSVLSVYANSEEEFDEWEQEYMEILYSYHLDHPSHPIELESKRMELMGYSKGQRKEFRSKVKQFVKKLNSLIERSGI